MGIPGTHNGGQEPGAGQDAGYADWQRWCEERTRSLGQAHGWLTLTSLQWLPERPSGLQGVPGLWSTDGTTAALSVGAEEDVLLVADGRVVDGTITATLADEESLNWVQFEGTTSAEGILTPTGELAAPVGTVVVELAMRAHRYLIRTRDSASPVLAGFSGVPMYDYRPEAMVPGRFEPYDRLRPTAIDTAHPDVPGVAVLAGDVLFDWAGRSRRLAAEQAADGSLAVTFHDDTNGHGSAGWRRLVMGRPRADGGIVLDFNRACNYPSAFTDFGTCPLPPDGNRIAAAVQAGERDPRAPHGREAASTAGR